MWKHGPQRAKYDIGDADKVARTGSKDELRNSPPAGAWKRHVGRLTGYGTRRVSPRVDFVTIALLIYVRPAQVGCLPRRNRWVP